MAVRGYSDMQVLPVCAVAFVLSCVCLTQHVQ